MWLQHRMVLQLNCWQLTEKKTGNLTAVASNKGSYLKSVSPLIPRISFVVFNLFEEFFCFLFFFSVFIPTNKLSRSEEFLIKIKFLGENFWFPFGFLFFFFIFSKLSQWHRCTFNKLEFYWLTNSAWSCSSFPPKTLCHPFKTHS